MESEYKIDRIKEINRQSLPQFRISEVEDLIQRLEDKADRSRVAKLMAKIGDLENLSKRNNVAFWNIPEGTEEGSTCEGIIQDISVNHMNLGRDIEIIRAHHTTIRYEKRQT